jgi:TolB protein
MKEANGIMKIMKIFLNLLVPVFLTACSDLLPIQISTAINNAQTVELITKADALSPSITPTLIPTVFQTREKVPTLIGGGGEKIAFSAKDPNYNKYLPRNIYTINTDGTQIIQITHGNYSESDPSWSPDGKNIVLAYADGGRTTLYKMEADGFGFSLLIKNPLQEWDPAWSPNGLCIAFVSVRDTPAPWTCKDDCNADIYVMDSSGSNITRLTKNPGYDFYPSWSPDGQWIVFTSERDGNREIYIMKSDGTNVIRLTENSTDDVSPSWSPNGRQIAFASNRGGKYDIYIMDNDGTNVIRLTDSLGWNGDPAWSPDGSLLAFVSNRDALNPINCMNNCNSEIYLMNNDSTNVERLTNTPLMESSPAWQP